MGEHLSCCRYTRVVSTTRGYDAAWAAVGSSPWVGDMVGYGLQIPATPTPDQTHRYLFRLCAVEVPPGALAVIRSIRQYLTIGLEVQVGDPPLYRILERPVQDAVWRFPDGGVSWHLRSVQRERPDRERFMDSALPRGYSMTRTGLDSAILARAITPTYTPLNSGMPYGDDIANMGTMRDLRYPRGGGTQVVDLGIEVPGACEIVLYASVRQTNPETRAPWPPEPASLYGITGVLPEDAFLAAFGSCRYWRIAAEMVVDVCHQRSRD